MSNYHYYSETKDLRENAVSSQAEHYFWDEARDIRRKIKNRARARGESEDYQKHDVKTFDNITPEFRTMESPLDGSWEEMVELWKSHRIFTNDDKRRLVVSYLTYLKALELESDTKDLEAIKRTVGIFKRSNLPIESVLQ